MTKKERYKKVIDWFIENAESAETELHYQNDYQLLVAVILSAQCTDKRVNMVTPALFEVFPVPEVMATSTPEAVFEYIKSCSYPNNKAKNLVGMAKKLLSDFGGEVPNDIDSLLTIPGVGRKTANVMLAVAFNKPAMPVDTHVFRVANRIGLTDNSKTPLETERELVKYIPSELLSKAHHWLILHGRYICVARRPKCEICGLSPWCKYYEKHFGSGMTVHSGTKTSRKANKPKK
ncbi:DNA-(apurinic or apyrimidinic site) lyase /endonuclease III [Porphyromonadaceae bacterium NLAE-zl-C104]|uniref:endonuclease III n=1 Tax=Proteiniphilum saccharofermentans TaxID=1642647 RepID=UPI000897AC5E|nr:endonuclease III [Proteiniphilum saccharofermentans]SEA44623.1 DNA-(apurinic or apyrimidinic site) lyase /endonuclease III [Porphyromonadaceae bacterium KH3R12]SFS86632.1 DNA-(apurinic or apyrimidinic site) lyase /endonuclease III [Porphyromonadaceae bacterium NLAE-zl-C104]